LLAVRPTPVVALNRAVALGMAHVPEAGAAEIERIRTLPGLGRYYLLHAAAGEFARRCGDQHAALAHYRRTETCGMTGPERRFLARKIAELP
jgi:RNA polymerase sigma-70 factor (ECF subfamily)